MHVEERMQTLTDIADTWDLANRQIRKKIEMERIVLPGDVVCSVQEVSGTSIGSGLFLVGDAFIAH